jgi:hypothetical protein
VVAPIRIGSDKIRCCFYETGIDLLLRLSSEKLVFYDLDHPFNQPMFDHQGSDGKHFNVLLFPCA